MEVTRLDDGLWRWTTAHPEWQPGGGWGQDVGCVYWETAEAVVLVDPLVPTEEAERMRFLDALDRDVERLGRDVGVLVTCSWHRRSADELGERYGGRILAPRDGPLPAGVTAVDAPTASEVVYWLADAAAVVPGDVLLGTEGGVRLCPSSWLGRGRLSDLAAELRPFLELPVERVLTSHGPPVTSGGAAALARALERYAPA
jgi:glyoxylase-like metal-dependent hydrolase (beta-lactamase superfamily II)